MPPGVPLGRLYIIDFEMARHLPLGPRAQGPVQLTGALIQAPLGVSRFDPYAWDMYCVGVLFDEVLEVSDVIKGQMQLLTSRAHSHWHAARWCHRGPLTSSPGSGDQRAVARVFVAVGLPRGQHG